MSQQNLRQHSLDQGICACSHGLLNTINLEHNSAKCLSGHSINFLLPKQILTSDCLFASHEPAGNRKLSASPRPECRSTSTDKACKAHRWYGLRRRPGHHHLDKESERGSQVCRTPTLCIIFSGGARSEVGMLPLAIGILNTAVQHDCHPVSP